MSDENNESSNGHFSIIAQLAPGAVPDANEKEEIVPLLGPDKLRPVRPDGTVVEVNVVFGYLDGASRAEWGRVADRNGKRGKANYEAANAWLFQKKIKRIEGLDGDPLLGGLSPIEYFIKNKNGNGLLNQAVNEYFQRQVGSADEGSKSS